MRNISGLETVYRDYSPKDVQFYYIYKTVQHPLVNNFVTPYSLKERLMHVAEIKRRTGTQIPWICDTMENDVMHAFGAPGVGVPNGEFVIDPKGKIVRKRFWSNPATLRKDLEELIGPVEKPTTVADLDVVFKVEPRKIASGVAPRPELPELSAIKIEPDTEPDDQPFFVKLRAEADSRLLRRGKGQLYLGFYLDPLYQVHWNNRAGRVEVELSAKEGVTIEPATLQGPEVKEDADVDPREFLIEVSTQDRDLPIDVTVKYVACDDAETFCVPVTQRYRIHLTRARDAGSRPGTFMPTMFSNVMQFDKNKDGRIVAAELPPGRATMYIGHIDFNGDEVIERAEVDTFERMFNNGRGLTEPPQEEPQGEDDATTSAVQAIDQLAKQWLAIIHDKGLAFASNWFTTSYE